MIETDKAYIAGLLDGEAYIGIKKTVAKRNGRVNPAYQERIQVRMVDEQAINFLSDMLGGAYYREKPSAKNGRPLYCFQASDKIAARILKTVLPYLRIKKANALAVLELRNLKNNPDKEANKVKITGRWGKEIEVNRWRHSQKHINKCNGLWNLCKKLNRVGV